MKRDIMNYQLGIYIDLPREWREKIGKIKNNLKQPSNNTVMPHISLYICALKKENFSKIINAIKNIKQNPLEITLGKVEMENDGFYYLSINPQNKLLKFHKNILEKINKLREGLIRTKDQQRLRTNYYSKKQINNIKKYGYARVLDMFTAHITLGINNAKNDLSVNLQNKIDRIKQKSFFVRTVAITLFEEEKLEKPILSRRVKLK